jgi:membrane-associated phospholipid phosphatase
MFEIGIMKKVASPFLENFPLKVGIACVIAFLGISIYFPKGNEVYFINSFHTSFLDWALTNITLLGHGLLLVPIVVFSTLVRFRYTIMISASAIICALLTSIFKRGLFSETLRPASVLDANLLHFAEGVDIHHLHSFPSGHTATAFVIAMLLSLFFRDNRGTILFFVVAMMVGISRVYLVQHFMGDVAAGAIIGIFSVAASYSLLFTRYRKTRWLDRRIQIKLGRTSSSKPEPIGN